jgi:hypothetical protein
METFVVPAKAGPGATGVAWGTGFPLSRERRREKRRLKEVSMLAQATGIYRERPAAGPLCDHFACAWVHRLPATEAGPILVVPDGSIDLQWVDDVLRIAGPDREPQAEALAPGAIVVGFRFRPGHASEWLGLSAAELLNRRIPWRKSGAARRAAWRRK